MGSRLGGELRLAVRRLRRRPGFSLSAALVVAVAITAATALGAFVDAALFRKPNVADPSSLVHVYLTDAFGKPYGQSSWADVSDLARSAPALSAVAGYATAVQRMAWGASPERQVTGAFASGTFFAVLGLRPALGRTTLDRGQSGGVVLDWDFWTTAFEGSAAVLGSTVRLDGTPYPVIGVAPRGFSGLNPGLRARYWLLWSTPTGGSISANRSARFLSVVGRLDGATNPTALRAQLAALSSRLAGDYPDSNRGRAFSSVPFTAVRFSPDADRTLRIFSAFILGGALLLLLLVCANLGGFVLARAEASRADLVTRLALGAGRGALLRQEWMEAALISVGGMVLGVGASRWLVQRGLVYLSGVVPLDLAVDPGLRMLAFTLILGGSASVAFGVVPLLSVIRGRDASSLGSALRRVGGGASPSRWLHTAVALQVWVAVALGVTAVTLAQSLAARVESDMGFRSHGLSFARVATAADSDATVLARRFAELTSVLEREVGRVGQASWLPLSLGASSMEVGDPAGSSRPGVGRSHVAAAIVDDGYFDAMGIPLVAGALFDRRGRPDDDVLQVVVTRAFVRAAGGGGAGVASVGRLLSFPGLGTTPRRGRIVGVVADHAVKAVPEAPTPLLYLNLGQMPVPERYLVGSTTRVGSPEAFGARIERVPGVEVRETFSMADHVKDALLVPRLLVTLFSAFGVVAALLVVVGVLGASQHALWRRIRELAVRQALGAAPGRLGIAVVGESLAPVGRGAVLGYLTALGAYWVLRGYFVGAVPWQPTVLCVALALPVVTTAAAAWPAWRRLRGDLYPNLQ